MVTENDFIDFLKNMNGEAFLPSWLKEWELFKEEKLSKQEEKIKEPYYEIRFGIYPHELVSGKEECSYHNLFHTKNKLTNEKFEAIKKAIEFIVNGQILVNADKNYEFTKKDMQKCFEESRKTNSLVGFKYDNFYDFINSLNK